jgi:hypothetical protein
LNENVRGEITGVLWGDLPVESQPKGQKCSESDEEDIGEKEERPAF